MGLLDDAIREHLELKRRRGADPNEVEREQHEALDPIVRGSAPVDDAGGTVAIEQPIVARDDVAADAGTVAGGVPEEMPAEPPPGGGATELGETAELDMRTVLGDEHLAEDSTPGGGSTATPGVAGGARPAPAAAAPLRDEQPASADDSLEWEMPGAADADAADAELEEDVLEETPDFLRETPEQDRLWFEQRPPRDFDFDK